VRGDATLDTLRRCYSVRHDGQNDKMVTSRCPLLTLPPYAVHDSVVAATFVGDGDAARTNGAADECLSLILPMPRRDTLNRRGVVIR